MDVLAAPPSPPLPASRPSPLLQAFLGDREAAGTAAVDGAPPRAAAPVQPLLTATEVGRIFGVCDRTLRRWARAGHLVPVRVGRTLRYRRQDVEAVIVRRIVVRASSAGVPGEC
jgi:excisionase family DNA binding protein